MAVTIKQIAAEAGVSRGTVDRVLHSRSGVKPEVAEHVRNIAAELGFRPNRAGKILAARKQPLKIGVFLPSVNNAFFGDVVAGYRAAEREHEHYGVSMVYREVEGYNPLDHLATIRELVNAGCGALCVSTVDTEEIRAYVNVVSASGIPVVAINNDLTGTARLCYVGTDYGKSGRVAASLLRKMVGGPMNLVVVTGSLNVKGHNDRIRGFSQTLREYKTAYNLVDVFESNDNDNHAYSVTHRLLAAHPEINCIYVAAAGAAGVGRAVAERSLQHKIHIAASDDVEEVRGFIRDGVIDFTVCQEPYMQGYNTVRLLFDYFVDDRRRPPENYITGTVIKIRENLD